MERAIPRILVADTGSALRELQAAVGDEAELIPAQTLEQAVSALRARRPDVVVVGYHFDELRPFRFIRYAHDYLEGTGVPIVLLKVLPMDLGATTEAQLRAAYRDLGVDVVFNLFEDAQREGRDATLKRLREVLRAPRST